MNYTNINSTDMFCGTICRLQNDLYKYILPVIVVTGSIGNTATLLVFRKGKFGKMSVGVYMYAYSVINLVNLFLIFGQSWVADTFELESIGNLSEWTCKVWNFLYRVMTYSCVWFIVALTVDRYICVCHSLDAKRLCTVFLANITVVFILVGLIFVSVHAMWSHANLDGKCTIYPYDDLHITIWRWVSMSSYCFIPFIALFLLDARLIIAIWRKRKKLMKSQRSYTFTSATLAISVMYLLLNLPATITNIMEYSEGSSRLSMERAISDFLSCGNPTIFFFMCLIFSKTFRSELVLLLRKKAKTRNVSNDINLPNINKYEYIECASETFV